MKKLTSLQILMVLGLGLNASAIFCNEAVDMEVQAGLTLQAGNEVLQDLAQVAPEEVEKLIANTANLKPTFQSVISFMHEAQQEIDNLKEQAVVNEAEVARLALELDHAQAALEQAIALQRTKHKRPHHLEQKAKDDLMKGEQGVKTLNERSQSKKKPGFFNMFTPMTSKQKSKSKAKKAARAEQAMDIEKPMLMDNADEAIAMMDDQMMDDEVVVQSTSKKSPSSKKQQPSKPQSKSQPKKKSKKS